MKKTTVVFLLMYLLTVPKISAQFVNIPDANFRAALQAEFSDCFNASDQLDTTCIESLEYLDISGQNISNLEGIQYFKGLSEFNCSNNPSLSCLPPWPNETPVVVELDQTNIHCLPSIQYYLYPYSSNGGTRPSYCSADNNLNNCDFSAVAANLVIIPDRFWFLEELKAQYPDCFTDEGYLDTLCAAAAPDTSLELLDTYNKLSRIDGIQYFKQLTQLQLAVNSDYFDIAPETKLPPNLRYFNIIARISRLPSLPSTLQTLVCGASFIATLPILPNSLDTLVLYENDSLTSLPALPNGLNYLECWHTGLATLPTLPDSLTYLNCTYNRLTSLPTLPNRLGYLNCSYNYLNALPDLPDSLTGLDCNYNLGLGCLSVLPNNLDTLSVEGTAIACLANIPQGISAETTLPICNANNGNGCPFIVQPIEGFVVVPDTNLRIRLKWFYPSCFNADDMLDTLCAATVDTSTAKFLSVYSGQITDLDGVQYFKNLRGINCQYNELMSLPKLPENLEILLCGFNQLTNLPTLPNSLLTLEVSQNPITSLPALPANLQYLEASYNQLTSLPMLPNSLDTLICFANSLLTNLPALPSGLRYMNCWGNSLSNLPALPTSLTHLECGGNQLSNLPELPNALKYLGCFGNTGLLCLPILPPNLDSLVIDGTGLACLPNIPAGTANSTTLPVCTPTLNPNQCTLVGTYILLAGNIFIDANNNGMKDANEIPRAGVKVSINDSTAAYTDRNGYYVFEIDSLGVYTATITLPTYFTTPQGSQTVTFTSATTLTKDFPLTAVQAIQDFAISVTNLTAARPGFPLHFRIKYENVGTIAGNAMVKFAHAALYSIDSTSVAHTFSGDTLIWNFSNVPIGFEGYIYVYGTLSASAVLGSTQAFYVSVNKDDLVDNNISNNWQMIGLEVKGSYDPNDKQGTRTLTPTQVANGEFIDYTIRFQNTGTDTAFTVVIADTLANNLQANTLEIISASHNSRTGLKGNIIYFKFPNILLPDSIVNEPLSHGFIKFRVKPNTNLMLGDVIKNKAAIYFDFNAPIITNTVNTVVAIPTSIAEKVSRRLEVYPNPLEGEILTVPNMRGASAKLLSLEGKELRTWSNIGEQISLQNVVSGMYLLEVLHEGQRRTAKVVVK